VQEATSCVAGRTAVEREFGRLKNERALSPRVREIEGVQLHADLTILASYTPT
jgi:hypothetical protein